nr:Acyl-CoA N-acyltransferase protein [Ipomoea batatas]
MRPRDLERGYLKKILELKGGNPEGKNMARLFSITILFFTPIYLPLSFFSFPQPQPSPSPLSLTALALILSSGLPPPPTAARCNLTGLCSMSQKPNPRVSYGLLLLFAYGLSMGIGADFARAYLSNVCVAKELRRNGLGYALIAQARMVAEEWGISDLYVHVAIDNEPALNLYKKCGFVYESEEPAWQARHPILFLPGLPNVPHFQHDHKEIQMEKGGKANVPFILVLE